MVPRLSKWKNILNSFHFSAPGLKGFPMEEVCGVSTQEAEAGQSGLHCKFKATLGYIEILPPPQKKKPHKNKWKKKCVMWKNMFKSMATRLETCHTAPTHIGSTLTAWAEWVSSGLECTIKEAAKCSGEAFLPWSFTTWSPAFDSPFTNSVTFNKLLTFS